MALTTLKNIGQLVWVFPIYGKIKNVPNHQSDNPIVYHGFPYRKHQPRWDDLKLRRSRLERPNSWNKPYLVYPFSDKTMFFRIVDSYIIYDLWIFSSPLFHGNIVILLCIPIPMIYCNHISWYSYCSISYYCFVLIVYLHFEKAPKGESRVATGLLLYK